MAVGLEMALRGAGRSLRGARLGLVCNQASVDGRYRHAAVLLKGAGFRLEALFGPEHGYGGDIPYFEPVERSTDRSTGLKVYSLYGRDISSLKPLPQQLDGLDGLVFDLPLVGCRYYTYEATLMRCMEAAAEAGLFAVVLDRPNPIGGRMIEGPSLKAGYESPCGLYDIPPRHGLTAGELARLYRAELSIGLDLRVVACRGYLRSRAFERTGAPWVAPSPNMASIDTAFVYPGACLFEGTNLSEGRGTARPFLQFGAPWLDGERLAASLNGEGLPGVRFRAATFIPAADKHAGERCLGAEFHVTDRRRFLPFRSAVAAVIRCREQAPDRFRWRTEKYEFVEGIPAFDLLCGSARERLAIENGCSLASLARGWADEERSFARRRLPHLLYGD